MTDSDYAAGQLRIIRALMERATVYRSISAPTALAGGLLSLVGFAVAYDAEYFQHHPLTTTGFIAVWLAALAVTGLTNLLILWRGSKSRGEPFFSSGMKLAARSLAPSFFVAGLLTITVHHPIYLAVAWILLYGIGLLSTQHFAPRSLTVLGVMFFLAGSVLLICLKNLLLAPAASEPSTLTVSGIMAATFGGFHLVYVATIWALGEDRPAGAVPGSGAAHV